MASAIGDTISETLVTRDYLDLRVGEIRVEIAEVKADILKWMFGTFAVQTIVIIGALAALFRLLR